MDDEELLTVVQAATQVGSNESTIRTALDRGRLPYVVKYGRKLIKPADLETWNSSRKMGRPKKEPDGQL